MAEEAKDTTNQIKRFKKGDQKRTAMHADVMNEIIDKLNALLNLTVIPKEAGEFFFSDANVVLLMSASGCGTEEPPTSGTFVCGVIDGVKQWLSTEECDCGVDGGSA